MTLKEIAESLSTERVIELMESLGATEHRKTGDAVVFNTICHNCNEHDGSMKLYYYPKTHTFHCYTRCGETFNIYEMFKKRYELLETPYDFYKDIVKKIDDGQSGRIESIGSFYETYESIYEHDDHTVNVNMPHIPKSILNIYTYFPTPEWLADGISEEAMKLYNIKYSISENKIIIPHYDVDDNLIGIRGRALNEEDMIFGKYMPVMIEGKLYNHPLAFNLYGLNVVKDNIKRMKIAIIAEGEKSALQAHTFLGQDRNVVVACCGSTIHQYQIDLLRKAGAERIIIAFDKEGTNLKEQNLYIRKLSSICNKYKNFVNMGYMYDSQKLLSLKQSPFDRGLETFNALMKTVTWV
jgi:hypothetical protein